MGNGKGSLEQCKRICYECSGKCNIINRRAVAESRAFPEPFCGGCGSHVDHILCDPTSGLGRICLADQDFGECRSEQKDDCDI